jgi:hypothetical protein
LEVVFATAIVSVSRCSGWADVTYAGAQDAVAVTVTVTVTAEPSPLPPLLPLVPVPGAGEGAGGVFCSGAGLGWAPPPTAASLVGAGAEAAGGWAGELPGPEEPGVSAPEDPPAAPDWVGAAWAEVAADEAGADEGLAGAVADGCCDELPPPTLPPPPEGPPAGPPFDSNLAMAAQKVFLLSLSRATLLPSTVSMLTDALVLRP